MINYRQMIMRYMSDRPIASPFIRNEITGELELRNEIDDMKRFDFERIKEMKLPIIKEPCEEIGLIFDDTNERLIYNGSISNGTTSRVGGLICQHL